MANLDAQALVNQLQQKMRKLADEFALGEINNEQFGRVYEHYLAQMNLAQAMLADAENAAITSLKQGETVALKNQFMGKAKAMAVYYHATGQFLETLGDFELSLADLRPTLEDVRRGAEVQTQTRGADYLLFTPGQYSTAVMVFSHEPVIRQIALVQSMHKDFETANEGALRSGSADATRLVYPFVAFVRRSIRKPIR